MVIQEFFFNENDDASGRDNEDNAKDNENNIETRNFPKTTFEMPHNLSIIFLYASPFMLLFFLKTSTSFFKFKNLKI
jgi:hypothetical protein